MLEAAKQESRKKNLERAKRNLEKEQTLKEEQAKLASVTQALTDLRNQYEQLSTQQAALMKQYNPTILKQKLQEAIDESDEHSEAIVTDFNSGNININQFIDQYFKERKKYHLRKAKMECIH